CSNTVAILGEIGQLRFPLHTATSLVQFPDEKPLVIVLGIRQCEGIGADTVTEVPETDTGYLVRVLIIAAFPNVRRISNHTLRNDFVGEPKLVIEFQSTRLYDHRA